MIKCQLCNSPEVIKHGFNYSGEYSKQRYKCLKCDKLFSEGNRLPRSYNEPEIISLCFDLYLKGLSYRVIQRQVLEQYKENISHVSIYNWIQDYTYLMKSYTDTLKPKLSGVWQMDETQLPFKGEERLKVVKNKANWLWCCVDTGTRFCVDAYLGLTHNAQDGSKFFSRIQQLKLDAPGVICTDGNKSYESCMYTFYPNAKHLQLKSISLEPKTSFIERFNGCIKNRTKTMRCFDAFYPCQTTMTAFQLYYNFLRPHMSLDNRTPAQEAGINLDLKNRWATLIRYALVANN